MGHGHPGHGFQCAPQPTPHKASCRARPATPLCPQPPPCVARLERAWGKSVNAKSQPRSKMACPICRATMLAKVRGLNDQHGMPPTAPGFTDQLGLF